MTATVLPQSWEKQTYYQLSNGWIAVEEEGHYGWFIRTLENKKTGKRWEASNGIKENKLGADHYNKLLKTDKYIDLPDFAKDWKEKEWPNLVRRKFTVNWK